MKIEKFNNILAYIRTVQINESLKTDYAEVATVLKGISKEQALDEFYNYVTAVIDDNTQYALELSKMTSKARKLQSDMNILQKENDALKERLIQLKNK